MLLDVQAWMGLSDAGLCIARVQNKEGVLGNPKVTLRYTILEAFR